AAQARLVEVVAQVRPQLLDAAGALPRGLERGREMPVVPTVGPALGEVPHPAERRWYDVDQAWPPRPDAARARGGVHAVAVVRHELRVLGLHQPLAGGDPAEAPLERGPVVTVEMVRACAGLVPQAETAFAEPPAEVEILV